MVIEIEATDYNSNSYEWDGVIQGNTSLFFIDTSAIATFVAGGSNLGLTNVYVQINNFSTDVRFSFEYIVLIITFYLVHCSQPTNRMAAKLCTIVRKWHDHFAAIRNWSRIYYNVHCLQPMYRNTGCTLGATRQN